MVTTQPEAINSHGRRLCKRAHMVTMGITSIVAPRCAATQGWGRTCVTAGMMPTIWFGRTGKERVSE